MDAAAHADATLPVESLCAVGTAVPAPAFFFVVVGDELQELIGRCVDVPPQLGDLFFEGAARPIDGSEAAGGSGWGDIRALPAHELTHGGPPQMV